MRYVCMAILAAVLVPIYNASAEVPVQQVMIDSKFVEVDTIATKELGWYFAVDAGMAIHNDSDVKVKAPGFSESATLSYDNSLFFGGALGYDFGDSELSCGGFPLRTELGFTYTRFDWKTWREGGINYDESDNHTSFLNLMLNGYWDINTGTSFTPFLMGGAGITRANIEHLDKDYDDTVFAGQAGAGISYQISETQSAALTYRYFVSQDIEFKDDGDTTEIENNQQYIGVGLWAKF